MGNYGVKLRKPEELPDFDQPIDYEEEKKRFEPVKVEEQNDKESHKDYSQPSYQETELSPTERATSTEENHQRMGKTRDRKQLSEFQGKYLQPFRNSHRKAVYVSEETQRSWTSWCGKSVSREQAFQDMWSRCFENISTNTKMMWKDGGNSEVLHSSNASLRRVTVFSECSNTVWAYNSIFYISKVCLCNTNRCLYHKDPCPEGEMNYSKVVIKSQNGNGKGNET